MTQFQAGQRVKVARGQSIYVGQHGIVFSHSSTGTVRVTLDSGTVYGFYESSLDAWPEPKEVPSASTAPVVKQQRAQPDLAAFFKGQTNYAPCPNCSTGKLVPMFSGQALCDQACERTKVTREYFGKRTYWATWSIDPRIKNQKGGLCTIWKTKDSAEWWNQQTRRTRLVQVEWLADSLPAFEPCGIGTGAHEIYNPTEDEVREVAP